MATAVWDENRPSVVEIVEAAPKDRVVVLRAGFRPPDPATLTGTGWEMRPGDRWVTTQGRTRGHVWQAQVTRVIPS